MKKIFISATQLPVVKKERKPRSFDGEIDSGVKLIATITAMGDSYNPVNINISKENVIVVQANITAMNNASVNATNDEKQLLIDRTEGFNMIDVMATDSLNALKSSEKVEEAQITNASHMVARIRGKHITPIKIVPPVDEALSATDKSTTDEVLSSDSGDADLNQVRHKSVSFQKMGVKLGSLFTLISYYKSLSSYQTNEVRLKIEALFIFYNNLMDLNAAAENAIAITNNARDARNEAFFNNVTGARYLYTQVKKYIASTAGGTKSSYYKLVKGLPFPNLIIRKLRTATTNY